MSTKPPTNRIDELLQQLARVHPSGRVSLSSLAGAVDQHVAFPLLIALALMTLVPLLSTLAGILSVMVFTNLVKGGKFPLPKTLGQKQIPLSTFATWVRRSQRFQNAISKVFVPLWPRLCQSPFALRFHSVYGMGLSLGTVIPLPGVNYLFAPALLALTLALASGNAVLAILAYLLPIVEIAGLYALIFGF